jgi:hypothetical protein
MSETPKHYNYDEDPVLEIELMRAVERLTTRLLVSGEAYKYGPNGAQLTESIDDYDDVRGEAEVAEPNTKAPMANGAFPNMRYSVIAYQPRTMDKSKGLTMTLTRSEGIVDGHPCELMYNVYRTGTVMRSVDGAGSSVRSRANQNEVSALAQQLRSIIEVSPPRP